MTPPSFERLMGMLAAVSSRLAGRDGLVIRGRVEELARILADQGPDVELRIRAARELEHLVDAISELAGTPRGGMVHVAREIDLTRLAHGLHAFATYLREPTAAHQAQVERVVATMQGAAGPAVEPAPLDDGWIGELAIEAARRHGLHGAALHDAVERMTREMQTLVRRLELRAQQEASRANAMGDAERLVDSLIKTQTSLALIAEAQRADILDGFRVVDVDHMAEGLRVFATWLSRARGHEPVAYVAELRRQLAAVLGPPTDGDPLRSEVERRAEFERDIKLAIDQIFRGPGPATA